MISPVRADVVRRSVKAKGFVEEPKAGGRKRDHEMFFLHVDGRKTGWWVKLSYGVAEMRTDEIKANARPLGLSGDDLHAIVSCKHDPAKTLELYRTLNPPPNDRSCPLCVKEVTGDQTIDEEGRVWHPPCALRELSTRPWILSPEVCPSCGVAAEGQIIIENPRRWHRSCATNYLATRRTS